MFTASAVLTKTSGIRDTFRVGSIVAVMVAGPVTVSVIVEVTPVTGRRGPATHVIAEPIANPTTNAPSA